MPRVPAIRFELATLFLLFVGLGILGFFANPEGESWLDYIFVSVTLSLYFSAFNFADSLLIAFVIYVSGDHFSMFGIRLLRPLPDIFWGILAVILGSIVVFFVYRVAFPGEAWSLGEHLVPSISDRPLPTISGAVCLILGAAAEEFIFRGYFLARFTEVTRSLIGGVLLSSMSFAILHMYQGAVGVLSAFLLGIIFCLIVIPARSIWPTTVAHFLLNASYYRLLG